MTISDAMRKALFRRAGGRCECELAACEHHRGARCPHELGASFEAHRKDGGELDAPSTLVAMCATCHANVRACAIAR
jgi:hypothetical protein